MTSKAHSMSHIPQCWNYVIFAIWVFMENPQEVLTAHHRQKGVVMVGMSTCVSSVVVLSYFNHSLLSKWQINPGRHCSPISFPLPIPPSGEQDQGPEKALESRGLYPAPTGRLLDSWNSMFTCRPSWSSLCKSLIAHDPLRENLLQISWKMRK